MEIEINGSDECKKMPALSNEEKNVKSDILDAEATDNKNDNEIEVKVPKLEEAENGNGMGMLNNGHDAGEEIKQEIDQDQKIIQNGKNIKEEEKNDELKDIIVSIRDENSRSSTEEEESIDQNLVVKTEEKKNSCSSTKIQDLESEIVEQNGDKDQEEEDDEDAPLAKRSKKRVVEDDEDDDDDDEDEDDDDDDDDEEEEEEEEDLITQTKLRYRPKNAAKEKAREIVRQHRELVRQVSKIVRKSEKEVVLNAEEDKVLAANPKVFDEVMRRRKKRETTELRKQEIEDSPKSLAKKCERMAKTIQKAKNLIVYTGAGISTAANIPDYRGPNGVWTCLDQGRDIATCDLAQAEPTFTHMSLLTLFKKGKLKHIVSQNCDGLHLRSGIPRYALSELHGNMFIEVCKHCKPMRPYLRLFDVTERTSKHKHNTMRRCHVCGNSLIDTIVHFGERYSCYLEFLNLNCRAYLDFQNNR
jgi:hypothetical protein